MKIFSKSKNFLRQKNFRFRRRSTVDKHIFSMKIFSQRDPPDENFFQVEKFSQAWKKVLRTVTDRQPNLNWDFLPKC